MARSQERRRHPRYELLAQVQVAHDQEVYILSTQNLSRGGVFLIANPRECPDLSVGVEVDLVIFVAEESENEVQEVRLRATIVRVNRTPAEGFGLQFDEIDPEGAERLEGLITLAATE
jgi:hypothetical protein